MNDSLFGKASGAYIFLTWLELLSPIIFVIGIIVCPIVVLLEIIAILIKPIAKLIDKVQYKKESEILREEYRWIVAENGWIDDSHKFDNQVLAYFIGGDYLQRGKITKEIYDIYYNLAFQIFDDDPLDRIHKRKGRRKIRQHIWKTDK